MAASTTFAPGTSSGYSLPGGGSTPAPAPVQPPLATSEDVALGGTPTPWTFGAFSDPDGQIAGYQARIENSNGTTSIASGAGLGAYAVTGFANGNAYTLYLDALDTLGNILATAIRSVRITPATTGGAWEVVVDYNLLGIDPVDLSGAATALTMLQKGGIDFLEVTTSRTGTGAFNAAAGANGLTASNVTGAASGTGNIAWDATPDVSLVGAGTLTWEDWQAPLAIQFLIKDFVWSGSTQWDLIVGFARSLTGPVSVNNSVGWRINDNGANTTFQVRRYSSGAVDTNVITGQAYNTDYVLSIIIYGALVAAEWQSAGSTSLPSDPRTGLGPYTPGWGSFGAGSMSVPNNKLCPFLSLAKSSSLGTPMTYNIAGVRILRFQ
jgi:hypothetical protein